LAVFRGTEPDFLNQGADRPDIVAGVQARCRIQDQRAKPLLALDQRARPEIIAVEVEQIEQEKNQRRCVAAVR
jgi:hypothetical protein